MYNLGMLDKNGERKCCPTASREQGWRCSEDLRISEEVARCDRRNAKSRQKDQCHRIKDKVEKMILWHMESERRPVLRRICSSYGKVMVSELETIIKDEINRLLTNKNRKGRR